jgi:hypothetical protein
MASQETGRLGPDAGGTISRPQGSRRCLIHLGTV